MEKYKSIIVTFIAGLCFIMSVTIAINGFVKYKQSAVGGITVTGSASKNFTSDLIVWRGSFSAYGETSKEAYEVIKKDSKIIKDYLINNGVKEEEFVFSSVTIEQQYRTEYNESGNVTAVYPDGYKLSQRISVQSGDVDNIEAVSRDITQLIDSGVEFISEAPEYYYTKLDELKLEMIELATENARTRVDKIAENSKSKVGKLLNANLGVFQITAQNSDSEEYSYGGAFNTWSKNKTASVTVKLNYEIN